MQRRRGSVAGAGALILALSTHAAVLQYHHSPPRHHHRIARAPPPTLAAGPPPPESHYEPERIRNFCIIAHIDHGKSTLADRLLQKTGTLADREMQDQVCDTMDIERERGITIKLNCARMRHTAEDGEEYILNLIDTPGHVDFGYEVSRSLAACEGALLVVDASQGVEAQTIANVYLALEGDLEIVPILNKIDLPGADVDRVATEVENTIGIDCSDAIAASAKVGIGIDEILEAIVQKVPAPAPKRAAPLRALIFDSYYDAYVGVVSQIRVVDGEIRKGDKVRFMASGAAHEVLEVGTMAPGQQTPVDVLRSGEVGYMHGGIKAVADARVGDTITLHAEPAEAALEGYQEPVRRATLRNSAQFCAIRSRPARPPYRCRWCTAASSRSRRPSTSCSASPSRSSRSTTPRSPSSPRRRARWASASAAASWGCCTWRLCRSGSSASTASTSS